MSNEIKLIRTPEISHKLVEIGANVTARIAALEIETLVASEDSVKGLKELRAELNKELSDFEEQRKLVKKGILGPYDEFETVYKAEVAEKYTGAINTLKDKIALVENKIKAEKEASVRSYFEELMVAEKIDFLKFEHLKLDINLSTTEKKYREQVNEFVAKVQDDLALIKTTDYEAEVLTEYKQSMNVSQAITTVKTRKDNEKKEAERLRIAEVEIRKARVSALGMKYMDMTDAYEFDDDIYIGANDLEWMDKEAFERKMTAIEARIKDKRANALPEGKEAIQAPKTAPKNEVSNTAEKPEIVTASFRVEGTMAQLRALGEYMKANGIIYVNLK